MAGYCRVSGHRGVDQGDRTPAYISRNTARKVQLLEETSFSYERGIQPYPTLVRRKVELDLMLGANASKAARERLTLIQLFEEPQAKGYDGGYDTAHRYAQNWSREQMSVTAEACVPLSLAPDEMILSMLTVKGDGKYHAACHVSLLVRPL